MALKMRSKRKQGLMTGEVSRMLGISRSTVIKFFEQGTLTGWKNPATGWRVIDPESVKTLKRKRKWVRHPATQKEG